jgi:hypothetical protein
MDGIRLDLAITALFLWGLVLLPGLEIPQIGAYWL